MSVGRLNTRRTNALNAPGFDRNAPVSDHVEFADESPLVFISDAASICGAEPDAEGSESW